MALPTGYGKSLCYGCLPGAFDRLRRSKAKSIVVVISPLVALMKDQVNNLQVKDYLLAAMLVNIPPMR